MGGRWWEYINISGAQRRVIRVILFRGKRIVIVLNIVESGMEESCRYSFIPISWSIFLTLAYIIIYLHVY